jgi:hypothetical protein
MPPRLGVLRIGCGGGCCGGAEVGGRDYVAGADGSTGAAVLEQISSQVEDYNAVAPHSALGFKSPLEYRGEQHSVEELAQMS